MKYNDLSVTSLKRRITMVSSGSFLELFQAFHINELSSCHNSTMYIYIYISHCIPLKFHLYRLNTNMICIRSLQSLPLLQMTKISSCQVSEYKAGIYASAPRRRSLFKWSAAGMDIVPGLQVLNNFWAGVKIVKIMFHT